MSWHGKPPLTMSTVPRQGRPSKVRTSSHDGESGKDAVGLSLQQHATAGGIDLDGAHGSVSEQTACVESAAPSGK